ncbi:MAG: DNA primase [Atopobiaceae bacterium]|nr:DNA primase [Atopobiaceae bacterium]
MITDEDKERVRQATDFQALVSETVVLRQRGHDFWGCCPFHHEKSPSFHINPSTGLWNCFGCHKGGDVFDYVMARENLDFMDAVRYLADRAGIELSEEQGAASRGPRRNRLIEALTEAESFYSTMLLRGRGQGNDAARRYLAGRGFGSDVCRRWGLGYAPGRGTLVADLRGKGFSPQEMMAADLALDRSGRLSDRFFDRVMFPIHDEQGRSIGFGGRVMGDGKPKYLNTRETNVFHKSKHLFAFDRAKETITARGVAMVVEGYTDVIALHEVGYTNAVAALGTALSLDHVKLLERFGAKVIICMFDGDAAGQKAAELSIRHLDKTKAEMRCVVLPDNQDPAEFLADHGPEALQPILREAEPLMSFVFDKKLGNYDLSVPGQRVAALNDLASVLVPLKGSVLLDSYVTQLASRLGTDVEATRRAVYQSKEPVADERLTPASRQAPAGNEGSGHAYTATPSYGYEVLSQDDRALLVVERELLAVLASNPDAVRPYGDRIAGFTWADSRHEVMAWAMLATPAGSSPAQVVAAATEVVPDAPRILSGGRMAQVEHMSTADKVAFLVDTVELHSTRRKVRQIKAQLAAMSGGVPGTDAQELFRQATDLQKRCNELTQKLSSVN